MLVFFCCLFAPVSLARRVWRAACACLMILCGLVSSAPGPEGAFFFFLCVCI